MNMNPEEDRLEPVEEVKKRTKIKQAIKKPFSAIKTLFKKEQPASTSSVE